MIKITRLTTFPLKSAKGINLNNTSIGARGLENDRHLAICDGSRKVLTAREFPKLLNIECKIMDHGIELNNKVSSHFVAFKDQGKQIDLKVFSECATGVSCGEVSSQWISDYLDTKCQLVYMNEKSHRPVLDTYGGQPGDVLSYADECPILLLSQESVQDLNNRLENEVTIDHFRPNIVVSGCNPYEEDTWKKIRIGSAEFDIAQLCKRCVFVTIDPETGTKDPNQEPLRTLSKYKKHPKGGVAFGVHLIPRKIGRIKKDDIVEVIS